MGEVFFLDIHFTVNGPPRVVEGVTEKPFIGLRRIEITGQGTVGGPWQPVVTEAAGNAQTLHTLDDFLRFAHGDSTVGCAVSYPEGQLTQLTVVFQGASSAKCDGSSNLLRIGACEVKCAIASETHSQDIDTALVVGIVLVHPFQDVVQLMGIPGSAWVLGCYDKCRNVHTHLDGIDTAVAQHAVEVASAEAGSVEEDDERRGFLREIIVFGSIDPEVVTTLDDTFFGR